MQMVFRVSQSRQLCGKCESCRKAGLRAPDEHQPDTSPALESFDQFRAQAMTLRQRFKTPDLTGGTHG